MPSGDWSYLKSLMLLSSIFSSSLYVTILLNATFPRHPLHRSYSLCHEKVLRESKMKELQC